MGIRIVCIFVKTSTDCPRVLDAIQIAVPGYKIQRTQQNTATRNVFPCNSY
nr:MAG TPA_asm: hypothetical protein [Caudoviricetes sp.]